MSNTGKYKVAIGKQYQYKPVYVKTAAALRRTQNIGKQPFVKKNRRDLRTLGGFLNSYSKDPQSLGLYANLARRRRPQFGSIRRMYKVGNLVRHRQKIIAASIRLGMNQSIYLNPRFNRDNDLEVASYLLYRPLMMYKCIKAGYKFFGKRKAFYPFPLSNLLVK